VLRRFDESADILDAIDAVHIEAITIARRQEPKSPAEPALSVALAPNLQARRGHHSKLADVFVRRGTELLRRVNSQWALHDPFGAHVS
jgi:hypothetical protein